MAVCLVIEAILSMAETGWIGSPRWRTAALAYGAFWAGLLHSWQSNFPGQPAAMFFTYSWLHAGVMHLLGNMAVLGWVGPVVIDRMGRLGFVLIWALSTLGGGALFGLMSASFSPMVGASGALFGLMGAMVASNYRADRDLTRALAVSAGLVALNLLTLILQGGVLAWQTHLGGYLVGLGTALLLEPWLEERRNSENSRNLPGGR